MPDATVLQLNEDKP